jgi:hypothetical protein
MHRGASHRDARRIGPDHFRREPSRDHCKSSIKSIPLVLANQREWQPFFQRNGADVWSRQAVGSAPEGASLSTWRFQGRFHASPARRISLRTAFLLASFECFPSARSRPCDRDQTSSPHRPAHLEPTDTCAPLAASAVRWAAPKNVPSVFSDAAAGIAAISIRLNFPVLFQAVRPLRGG